MKIFHLKKSCPKKVKIFYSCFVTVVKSLEVLDLENTNQFINVFKRPF